MTVAYSMVCFVSQICFSYTGSIPTSFAAKAANRTGMVTRLKGKNAWVRKIMQGKRCDYTARAIITPNASLDIDQCGVPIEVACKLSKKVLVTRRNLIEMRKLVRATCYPQAVALHRPDGKMLDLTHCDRANQVVRVGWTVERNLINGDRVILNRQPSLHRLNMLGHRIWVHPYYTFMLNPSVAPGYAGQSKNSARTLHARECQAVVVVVHSPKFTAFLLLSCPCRILSLASGF